MCRENWHVLEILIRSIFKKDSTFLDFNFDFGKKEGKSMPA